MAENLLPKEASYVHKFRALDEKQNYINAMVGELRKVCESLKDWQKTSSDLAEASTSFVRPEWSQDHLKEFSTLRTLLRAIVKSCVLRNSI